MDFLWNKPTILWTAVEELIATGICLAGLGILAGIGGLIYWISKRRK